MKKILSLLLVAVLVAAAVIMVPRLAHKCDDCEKFFVGTGYEANIIDDLFSSEEKILCKECAETHHFASIALGKDVSEFKRPLFD